MTPASVEKLCDAHVGKVFTHESRDESIPNTRHQVAQPITSEDSSWSSGSKLGRKVREFAHRSHSALKAGAQLPESPNELVGDLGDPRDQVARLRQKIHERRLGPVISWVGALQQQLEDRVG